MRTQVEALRRQRRTGHRIAQQTGLSPATVLRLSRRAGINCWRELDPQAPAGRYEYGAPGDLIHLDIRKLGRIGASGIARPATGRTGTGASAGTT